MQLSPESLLEENQYEWAQLGPGRRSRGGDSFGLSSSSADLQVMAVWAHSGLLGSTIWQVSSIRWSMTVDDAPGSICRSGHRNLAGGEGHSLP